MSVYTLLALLACFRGRWTTSIDAKHIPKHPLCYPTDTQDWQQQEMVRLDLLKGLGNWR